MRISPAFLDAERAALGESWFNQEYGCQFLDAVGALFRYDDIRRAISDEVEPLFPTERQSQTSDVKPLFGEGRA